jgi:hypothetical protein
MKPKHSHALNRKPDHPMSYSSYGLYHQEQGKVDKEEQILANQFYAEKGSHALNYHIHYTGCHLGKRSIGRKRLRD